MNDAETKRPSLPMLVAIVIGNSFAMYVGIFIDDHAYRWIEHSLFESMVEYSGYWMTMGAFSFLTFLCSCGPGSIWLRALALLAISALFAMIIFGTPVGFDAQDFVGILFLTFPIMMVLSLVSAFGCWRIGPPSLQAIQIRIVDIMFGTAVLALLFAVSKGEDPQDVIFFSMVSTPILAMQIAASAWCLLNRYAWLIVVGVLATLFVILTLSYPNDTTDSLVTSLTALVATGWIAVNIRLLGIAGWPLSRRRGIARSLQTKADSSATSP